MKDFAACPVCMNGAGDDDCASADCPACAGSGQRAVSQESIAAALSAKSWLDQHISDVFSDYCDIFKVGLAYGVNSWEINGTLGIIQDTSCRGCYKTEHHRLPLSYLHAATATERRALMRADADAAQAAREQQKIAEKRAELKRLEAEAARLELRAAALRQNLDG